MYENTCDYINCKKNVTKKVEEIMEFRNLDGYYFRVKRDDKWQNICFSDLTEDEMKEVTQNRSVEWLQSLAIGLGKVIRDIGDQLDLTTRSGEEKEEEENA